MLRWDCTDAHSSGDHQEITKASDRLRHEPAADVQRVGTDITTGVRTPHGQNLSVRTGAKLDLVPSHGSRERRDLPTMVLETPRVERMALGPLQRLSIDVAKNGSLASQLGIPVHARA